MQFKSDNTAAIHPQILKAIQDANRSFDDSYGEDSVSKQLQEKLNQFFGKEVVFYLTSTGTAANSLALSTMAKPYGAIFCGADSHIQTDEAGAPEFFTNGAKLLTMTGSNGKLDLDAIEKHIDTFKHHRPHCQKPMAISFTTLSEKGLLYSCDEIEMIHSVAKKHNLYIHMDGARFANALAALDISPADYTWKRGVDVLSFGATKNGALAAEMVVFFNHDLAEEFDYMHKRAGQLLSKTRYFSAQWLAYLEDDLWKQNAHHANQMASKLADMIDACEKTSLAYPQQANILFVKMPKMVAEQLWDKGAKFYHWEDDIYRLVTSWQTSEEQVEEFRKALHT